MFLLDDVLLAPLKGLVAVCRKVHDAAQEELEGQEQTVLAALMELHRQLETGGMDEREFDRRESELLDRLEAFRHDDGA